MLSWLKKPNSIKWRREFNFYAESPNLSWERTFLP